MDTRVCVACCDEKPISGVWYLMADGPGSFMCGSCFYDQAEPSSVPSRDHPGGVVSV